MKRIMLVRSDGGTNAGDLIQSIALSRLIGRARGFYRDHPHLSLGGDEIAVAAGFFCGPMNENPARMLFSGIYWLVTGNNVDWLKRSPYPIGARDPETYDCLTRAKVRTQLIGCATLTLPTYTGKRSGEYSVDVDGPGEQLTHKLRPGSFDDEWSACLRLLDKYRTAAAVHTTRLHVALPCVAMGTPVRYLGPEEGRTTIIKAIGLKHGVMGCPDVSAWKEQYISFLRAHLGEITPALEPVKPQVHHGISSGPGEAV